MKKLLKLLSVLTFTIIPVTSVIACGGGNIVPTNITDSVNIQDLLMIAQNNISKEFGTLIDHQQNVFRENQFSLGSEYYQMFNGLSSANETVITNTDFIDSFITKINQMINIYIIPALVLDNDLRILFNGIPANNILKIGSIYETKVVKVPFEWKKEDVDFGISNYDPGSYNIKYWYKFRMELPLLLSYKDQSNQTQTKNITQNYSLYFANATAEINKIINASSISINQQIEKQLIQIDLTQNNDRDDNERMAQAKILILNLLGQKNNLEINEAEFTKSTIKISLNENIPKYSAYEEANHFYNALQLPEKDSITYLEDYFQKKIIWNFNLQLDQWIRDQNFTSALQQSIASSKDNINAFGEITLTSWNISGLTLKNLTLNFINKRSDQTKNQWGNFMSKAIGTLFIKDGLLVNKFNIFNKAKNLIMYMDNSDFNYYIQQNKTLNDVSIYFSQKIHQKALSEKLITQNTEFFMDLNGVVDLNATLNNTQFVTKLDSQTLRVRKNPQTYFSYIKVKIDGFSFIVGSKLSKTYRVTFNYWIIKQGNSTIWN